MTRMRAIAGSALFLIVAPGVVAGLIPWLLTGRYAVPVTPHLALRGSSFVVILAALAFLLNAFARFALDGGGTPAPIAPTERLVVTGPYRYVRNPMYVAVVSLILAQAVLFADGAVLIYAAITAALMTAFVMVYEEPVLAARYGAEYASYCRAVPRWIPRLTPWRG